MLLKIVSIIASIILMYTASVSLSEKPAVLTETLDNLSKKRNGPGRGKFADIGHNFSNRFFRHKKRFYVLISLQTLYSNVIICMNFHFGVI